MFFSSISNNNGSINVNINGKKYSFKGNDVTIENGKIFVDGKEFKEDEDLSNGAKIVNVVIEGNINSLKCDCSASVSGNVDEINCAGSVTVGGSVNNDIDCGGSCTVNGDVKGNVDCGGSCTVNGSHIGNIDAGGSVRTGR